MKFKISLDSGIRDSASHLYELECLLGLAILLVYFYHVYGLTVGAAPVSTNVVMAYVVNGSTGVTLFFVLSGFLLSLPWLKYGLQQTSIRPSTFSFYKARALRILPLYLLTVLFAVVVSGKVASGLKAAVFGFVAFDIPPFSVVWWTLSTEVQFYLLLPLFFSAWFARGIYRIILLAAAALWLYFYTANVIVDPSPGNILSFFMTKSIFARLPAFLLGIAAALFYLQLNERVKRPESYSTRAAVSILALLTMLVLGLVLQHAAFLGDWNAEQSWHIHHTLEAFLWSILLLIILLSKPIAASLLVNRPMAIAGKLSYSLYLNHVPILFYMIKYSQATMGKEAYMQSLWYYLCPIVALVVSLCAAYLTYKWIELPFLNRKRKISTGMQSVNQTQ